MTRVHGRTALIAAGVDAASRVLITMLSIAFARVLGPQQMGVLAAAQLLPGLLLALNGLTETAALVRGLPTGSGAAQARGAARLRLLAAALSVGIAATAGQAEVG